MAVDQKKTPVDLEKTEWEKVIEGAAILIQYEEYKAREVREQEKIKEDEKLPRMQKRIGPLDGDWGARTRHMKLCDRFNKRKAEVEELKEKYKNYRRKLCLALQEAFG